MPLRLAAAAAAVVRTDQRPHRCRAFSSPSVRSGLSAAAGPVRRAQAAEPRAAGTIDGGDDEHCICTAVTGASCPVSVGAAALGDHPSEWVSRAAHRPALYRRCESAALPCTHHLQVLLCRWKAAKTS